MKIRQLKFFLLLNFFLWGGVSTGWAGYFLDESYQQNKPVGVIPSWVYGGSLNIGFYLNSLDVGGEGSLEYRIHKFHSLGLSAGGMFGGGLYDFGLDWRLFFTDGLMSEGHEDYFRIGAALLYFEKFDESYMPPFLSVGYGRNFIPFSGANLMCRLELRVGYALGEGFIDNSSDSILAQEGHMITQLMIGVFGF